MLEIWRRSDRSQLARVGGAYELECWTQYLFVADGDIKLPSPIASELPSRQEGVREYDVNFQDFIGMRQVAGDLIRVRSAKLDSEGFDRLLADLTASVANLPFDFQSPTFVPHERVSAESKDVLYHAFAYLRWAMFDVEARPTLSESVAHIEADPHRELIRRDRRTSLDRARRISPREIARLAANHSLWRGMPPDHRLAGTSLALRTLERRGAAALPESVLETIREETADTPENRFVKYLLSWIGALADRMVEVLGPSLDEASLETAVAIKQEVARLMQAGWLVEVSEMRTFPASSQVLQRKHGYRDLLGHYLSLVMASRYPIAGEDLRRIIEVKSASALYEYWVYFELVRSVERILRRSPTRGVRVDTADHLRPHVDHGVSVEFGPEVEVIYNRSFAGNRPKAAYGSYSLTLRPDVLLRVGGDVYVFDAKFRIEHGAGWAPKTEEERADAEALQVDEVQDDVVRWFKASDIHKMHAYRDAIRHGGLRVASAWAIYPGSEFRFYSDMEGRVIVQEQMPAELGGVGAIPLEPMGDRGSLDYVVRAMLDAVVDR